MTTQLDSPWSLITQYSMIALFAAQGLLKQPAFTLRWWLMVVLVLALSTLVFFWPLRPMLRKLYVLVEAVLLIALTILDQQFMFLGFIFCPVAAILLPVRSAFMVIGAMSIILEGLYILHDGMAEALYPGLAMTVGFISFGSVYYFLKEANKSRERTQHLLDELREAHQKLEAYTAQAQEIAAIDERNRIARELHDSVKQQAFAVSGQLGAARTLLQQSVEQSTQPEQQRAIEHVRTAETLMDEIRAELGQLIHALRPVALQDKGLASALREWGAGWAQQAAIALDIRIQGERPLPLETEQNLFRIIQEALSNISRHSGAGTASVCLDYSPSQLILTIHDDGQGFDSTQPATGIGLRTMRERAERLKNGTLKVDSTAGEGTLIELKCTI